MAWHGKSLTMNFSCPDSKFWLDDQKDLGFCGVLYSETFKALLGEVGGSVTIWTRVMTQLQHVLDYYNNHGIYKYDKENGIFNTMQSPNLMDMTNNI